MAPASDLFIRADGLARAAAMEAVALLSARVQATHRRTARTGAGRDDRVCDAELPPVRRACVHDEVGPRPTFSLGRLPGTGLDGIDHKAVTSRVRTDDDCAAAGI